MRLHTCPQVVVLTDIASDGAFTCVYLCLPVRTTLSSHTRSTLAAVSKYLTVCGLRLTAFGLENKICGVR